MKLLTDIIRGFLKGGLWAIGVFIVALIIGRVVLADETVAVREARLGEQDRSLNYKYTDTAGIEFEHMITLVVEKELEDIDCADINATLQASKDYAEERIKEKPEYKRVWAEILEMIEENWCYDDDN